VIHACYQKNNGALRVVDDPTTCKNNETALSWGQEGPQGPTGPTGPTGSTGPKGNAGVSQTYTARNAHDLPDENNLVGLTLPAGLYVVWATVDIFNDEGGDVNTICSMWTGASGTRVQFISSPGNDTAIFSGADGRDDQFFATLMGTVELTDEVNQVLVFCSPGGDPENTANADGQMIALKVDAVN
jgi:hypothetical protein